MGAAAGATSSPQSTSDARVFPLGARAGPRYPRAVRVPGVALRAVACRSTARPVPPAQWPVPGASWAGFACPPGQDVRNVCRSGPSLGFCHISPSRRAPRVTGRRERRVPCISPCEGEGVPRPWEDFTTLAGTVASELAVVTPSDSPESSRRGPGGPRTRPGASALSLLLSPCRARGEHGRDDKAPSAETPRHARVGDSSGSRCRRPRARGHRLAPTCTRSRVICARSSAGGAAGMRALIRKREKREKGKSWAGN